MDAYKKGISEKLAEYAVKKYKSYRRISDSILEDLEKLNK